MSKDPNDKPLVQFNDNGFVLNYSVTRNEEIAYIDYTTGTITFKQMPIPLDKIDEIIQYFKNSKADYDKYKGQKITIVSQFGFDEKKRRMMLLEIASGLKLEDIQDKVEFELIMPNQIKTMAEPKDKDLKLLREVIDPEGYFIKREIKD